MNPTRTPIVTAIVLLIALVAGAAFYVASDGDAGGATAPEASSAQALTVSARDTAKRSLSGVAVRLVDATGTTVTSGTTDAAGQLTLTFTPAAGSYAVIADTPTGYLARDDKDGGSSHVGGPSCDNVFLCIYLTATEVRAADGSTSIVVELSDVTVDQRGDLDDLWFEMTPPAVADEEPIGSLPAADEESIGSLPAADEESIGSLPGADDDVLLGGSDDRLVGAGLASVCVNVVHRSVESQRSNSGIWVRGEVYGFDGGWIWVEGPTINGGDPVQIPVEGGLFEGPLGIDSYGDHDLTRFELQDRDPGFEPVDLLPTLADGPGTSLPVGPAEGPAFESECFDFERAAEPASAGEPAIEVPSAPASGDVDAALPDATDRVQEFLDGFVAAHVAGDHDSLLDTLHPAVSAAFGAETCTEYVEATTGSIRGARLIGVGDATTFVLDTPSGPVELPQVIPFAVELHLLDGSEMHADAHLSIDGDDARWLTMCGADG